MSVYDVFHLMGGLALFLFGMHLMGASLEKTAGNRLKKILEQLTRSPLKGVLLGAGVTAIVQSSSATTVMVVGFVNSGIMQLRQAIAVVLGANVGTTVTAWFLSLTGIKSSGFLMMMLKPANFSPIVAFVGIIMLLGPSRRKDTAGILLGFAVLMFGMEYMSDAVKGLANQPGFTQMLTLLSNPIFSVIMGAVVTAMIQSSSASVGILQALANAGGLNYGAAIPIIMGQNIGTCVTAIISAIGANRNAKRVAAVHLYFNLIGTAVFLIVYYVLDGIIGFHFTTLPINAFGIAVVHTAFNVLSTLMMFPFMGMLQWLAEKTIRDDHKAESFEILDARLLNTPSIAIEQSRKLTAKMALMAREAFFAGDSLLDHFDYKVMAEVKQTEDEIDLYEDRLGSFLVQVSSRSMSVADSREVSKLLHLIGDLERISDHAVNVAEVAEEIHVKKLVFSEAAQKDTKVMRAAVREIVDLAVRSFVDNDLNLAERVEPLEEVVDLLRTDVKAGHVKRLQTGECTIELGFALSDLLTNLERSSDHCSNIAASVIEIERHGSVDAHEYLKTLRDGVSGERFRRMYEEYLGKYELERSNGEGGR